MSTPTGSIVRAAAAALIGAALLVPAGHAQQPVRPSPDAYRQLRWRFIGPEGNRFSAAAGIPNDPTTYYVGAASGGIYKTTDAGVHWQPIFDGQPVASIGSIAVAASDPNIVWAGTGEGKIRSHISVGQGIYKSTDAGRNWTLMGLDRLAASRASSSIRATPTPSSPARSATRTVRSRTAACFARPTAARPGRGGSSSTRTRAARTSRWT